MSIKLSDLAADSNTLLTLIASGDYLMVYDISESIDARKIKVITYANLLNFAVHALVSGQTAGDLFYASSASALARIAAGNPNTALKMNAGGTVPIYRDDVQSTASAGTHTPNVNSNKSYVITAQAVNATFNAPSGTPAQFQSLLFRIKDNGSARTLTWNAIYRGIGCTLPATTVAGKTLYVGFFYNSTDTKWDCPNAIAVES